MCIKYFTHIYFYNEPSNITRNERYHVKDYAFVNYTVWHQFSPKCD